MTPRFTHFVVEWNGEEFVARCPTVLDVSGHSRIPYHALHALVRKLAELYEEPNEQERSK